MADASPRTTDTSTDDTDENHMLEPGQGALVVASDSSDRSKDEHGDQKTLRRLAQNREAARKSRLRKKAYVQQLENSRLKLTQLEQELQRARQQGIFISSSADQSHSNSANGALAFDMEYARWLEEHNRQISELRAGVSAHASDNDLRGVVEKIMSHYDEIFRLKGNAAKADVFHVLSGMWKTPAERCFLWLGGFRARVGTMIAKESVKKRLASEDGMSYTEFTYQLLQGYDFLYMFKNMGVNVQIGGSDQWGNITAGTELIRKILQVEGAHGLTFPLLLKSDGTKFGKTEEGAIWLSSNMLSPYKFYQYFFAVPDVDVIRFMKILTFLSLDEIQELEESMTKPGYVPNTVQKRLAEEVTRFVHGEEGLAEALKATGALRPGAQTQLDSQTIEGIADDVPSCSLAYDQVLKSSLVDLAVSTGLLASKSAVRRLIKQGGLYLNNMRIDSEDKLIEEGDIVDGKVLLLSAGKKNKMVVRIS